MKSSVKFKKQRTNFVTTETENKSISIFLKHSYKRYFLRINPH